MTEVLAASIIMAASASEMSVNFYQTTWHYNPTDSYLDVCCWYSISGSCMSQTSRYLLQNKGCL
jgi:hypothetical protein